MSDMTATEKITTALKICARQSCPKSCPFYYSYGDGTECARRLMEIAADTLEEATRRQPNKPLVLSQIKALPTGTAIWMYSREECNMYPVEADTIKQRDYKDPALLDFYRYKPTPADIEAARKEHANE